MGAYDRETVLAIVDLALGDMHLRDRMFVGRRPDPENPERIVIQTGEDGRYTLPAVDRSAPTAVQTLIAAAQAHLQDVYGQPVPRCPLHDHALVARVDEDEVQWVCPDRAWSCLLGEYEECTWPPLLDDGNLAAALSARLTRRGVEGVRRIGIVQQDGRSVAEVGIWPMSSAIIDAVTHAAAPLPVRIKPCPGPLPRRVAGTERDMTEVRS